MSLTCTKICGNQNWKVDVGLPGKGNSNSHGATPVHLIVTQLKWIRTSRLSITNSLSLREPELLECHPRGSCLRLIDFGITQLKAQGPSRTCNESNEEGVPSPRRARVAPLVQGYLAHKKLPLPRTLQWAYT